MKKELAVGFVIASLFCGCETPAPVVEEKIVVREVAVEKIVEDTKVPLTGEVLERLKSNEGIGDITDAIKQFQFYISGRVTLEWEDITQTGTLKEGKIMFEDTYKREVINIKTQTQGLITTAAADPVRVDGGEIVEIKVSFDDKDEKNYLTFLRDKANKDGYFYLHVSSPGSGDIKGKIKYGEHEDPPYTVKYSDRPYLLISLEQRGGIAQLPWNSRGENSRHPGDQSRKDLLNPLRGMRQQGTKGLEMAHVSRSSSRSAHRSLFPIRIPPLRRV